MIPENNQKYAPFLQPKIGMKVTIMTEAGPKDNPKLKSPFYCDVSLDGGTYCLSFSWAVYKNVSCHPLFGADTKNWIGQTIVYAGKQPVKVKSGTVQAHMWNPCEKVIDLNDHLKTSKKQYFPDNQVPF